MYSSGQHWPSCFVSKYSNKPFRTIWQEPERVRQVPWMLIALPAPILTGSSLPEAQTLIFTGQSSSWCWAVSCWCFNGTLSMCHLSPNSTEIFKWLATAKITYVVFNSKRVFYRPGCISSLIPWCHTPRKTAASPAWRSLKQSRVFQGVRQHSSHLLSKNSSISAAGRSRLPLFYQGKSQTGKTD